MTTWLCDPEMIKFSSLEQSNLFEGTFYDSKCINLVQHGSDAGGLMTPNIVFVSELYSLYF